MEYLTCTSELKAIADAIRSQTGSTSLLYYPAGFISAIEQIPSEARLQYSVVTPTESTVTVYPGDGYDAFSEVIIQSISSDYVGTAISKRSMSDIIVNGRNITIPNGYYSSAFNIYPQLGSIVVHSATIVPSGSLYSTTYASGNGTTAGIIASFYGEVSLSTTISEGWVNTPLVGTVSYMWSLSCQLDVLSATTIIPSSTSQIVSSQKYLTGDITVAAIPSTYVGTGISTLSAQSFIPGTSDMYISSGYYLTGNQTIRGDSNLIASNIKSGISIFGITGTFDGIDPNIEPSQTVPYYFMHHAISEYSNSEITKVGTGVFNGWTISSVSLPSCSKIGSHAFNETHITDLYIPLCEYVGDYGFNSINIQSLSLPFVSQLGDHSFGNCSMLVSVDLPSCHTLDAAFSSCWSLTYVSIPQCLYLSGTFAMCSLVQSISIPLCKYIGRSTFGSCSSLTSVYAPSCEYLGPSCFRETPVLSINMPICFFVDYQAFYSCSSLTIVDMSLCNEIGSYAFAYCSSLVSAFFSSCISIGSSAFYSCTNLSDLSFPLCETIEAYAFASCRSLTNVNFPACTSISISAFTSIYSMSLLNLPGLSRIETNFLYGTRVSVLNLPNVEYITRLSYFSVHSLSIPNCVSIGSNTFCSLRELESLDCPRLESISASYCFQSCYDLKCIKLSVCSAIGSEAFKSCYNLLSAYLYSTSVVALDTTVFRSTPIRGYTESTSGVAGFIYVPSSLLSLYVSRYNYLSFSAI